MSLFTRSERKGSAGKLRSKGGRQALSCFLKGCKTCPLDDTRLQHPKMLPTGSKHPTLYILGEAPGADEDAVGRQFVGVSGKRLRQQIGRECLEWIRWNNAVRCRPPKNRPPSAVELQCCKASILKDIEATRPKIVMGVGNIPLSIFADGLTGIKRWRGRRFPIQVGKHTCWFYPILHPSFVNRMQYAQDELGFGPEWGPVFDRDVARVLRTCVRKRSAPVVECVKDVHKGTRIITECNREGLADARDALRELSGRTVAVDIEATRLRPYRAGTRLLSVAISDGEQTIAFPIDHSQASWTGQHREALLAELETCLHTAERVVAHNAAFEMEWFAWLYDRAVLGSWRWACTMQQAYSLDERPAGLGLNFLCMLHFGFAIKNLSPVDRRQLDRTPIGEVLKYNACDAKYAARLFPVQADLIRRAGVEETYRMQMQRLPTVVKAQRIGLVVNTKRVIAFDREYTARTETLVKAIVRTGEAREYKQQFGIPFNPSAPFAVATLLRDVARRREGLQRNGKYSTDKSVLKRIPLKIAHLLMEYRSVTKMHSTYVKGLLPGGELIYPDGRIHTTFNTAFTATGRLSSEDPNIQNWPMRTHPEIRGQIMAPPGYLLVSCDYGQIEPRLIGVASADPVLMRALFEDYDIHMDWTCRIAHAWPASKKRFFANREKDVGWKAMRTDVKSSFVLAGFYRQTMAGMTRPYGIPTHIGRNLYDEFWEMFAGVRKWQERLLAFYKKYGYVECLTGRRRRGPMTKNMVVNSSIQGSASDLVVDAWNRLGRLADREGRPQLQAVINIHDDLTFMVPIGKHTEEDLNTIVYLMLHPKYEWLTVPLQVELKVGRDWFRMKEIGKYRSDRDEWITYKVPSE